MREAIVDMQNLVKLLLIISVIFIAACVPESASKNRTSKSTQGSSSGDTTSAPDNGGSASSPDFTTGSVSWYDGNFVSGTLQISDTFSSVVYLRGEPIDTYLKNEVSNSNSGAVYCLVLNFNDPQSQDQYRVRAVPLSFNNFQTGQLEYTLRLDMNQTSNECKGEVNSFYGTTITSLESNTNNNLLYLSTLGAAGNARGYYSYSSAQFNNFSSAAGLPSNSIYDTWADGGLNSNVLVASSNGLSISTDDGVTFTNKTTTDGLVSNNITSVYADSAFNDFVIGTDSGISISVNAGTTFTTKTTANGLNKQYR